MRFESGNQYDYSLLNSRYEADVERNEIIEWNKDDAQYMDLIRIAEGMNFKQMQIEACRKGYKKLYEENAKLKSELLDIEEDRDYYKSKASSLEDGYLQLQDREIRLKKENEQLKQTIINLIENGLNELFGDKYRIISDLE